MNRGPKAQTLAEKQAKGTLRPSRDNGLVEIIEPKALPAQPDWLTPEGEEIWQDDIGRANAHMLATEKDSTAFANYANLQGMIIRCWRKGEAPPITALAEARKMQELFGIGGARSRVQKASDKGGQGNPFARNGRRT